MSTAPYANILSALPRGMGWRYMVTANPDERITHTWAILNEDGGIHVDAWRAQSDRKWIGGIELHSPRQLYGDEPTKPDHEHCWLLNGGPCWHDGSSLQFSEQVAPMLPHEGEAMSDSIHAAVLRLMLSRHQLWLVEREDS